MRTTYRTYLLNGLLEWAPVTSQIFKDVDLIIRLLLVKETSQKYFDNSKMTTALTIALSHFEY